MRRNRSGAWIQSQRSSGEASPASLPARAHRPAQGIRRKPGPSRVRTQSGGGKPWLTDSRRRSARAAASRSPRSPDRKGQTGSPVSSQVLSSHGEGEERGGAVGMRGAGLAQQGRLGREKQDRDAGGDGPGRAARAGEYPRKEEPRRPEVYERGRAVPARGQGQGVEVLHQVGPVRVEHPRDRSVASRAQGEFGQGQVIGAHVPLGRGCEGPQEGADAGEGEQPRRRARERPRTRPGPGRTG